MSLLASLKLVVARPHREARPFLLASGATAALAYWAGRKLRCPVLRNVGHASAGFLASACISSVIRNASPPRVTMWLWPRLMDTLFLSKR